ncbi:MAG: polyprenyl synthetase family protein [bacterium]|nr:polyprenyl synthetase family protein [bacterium]
MMQLKQYLHTKKNLVEEVLTDYLDPIDTEPAIIHEAMHYSVFNGGKRLRPILVFMGNQLFYGNEKIAYPSAVCVELIHCYSLVHDDLPALDNDHYRRGKLTCHKKFSEQIAILTGDALLTKAIEILTKSKINTKDVLSSLKEITATAGSCGMIGGQVQDLQCEKENKTLNSLEYIHKNKTSKLIESSLVLGAITANANKNNIENLRKYGESLGLIFQITDDILDITADKTKLGKRGSDLDNNKLTYPALLGLDKSRKLIEKLQNEGEIILNKITNTNQNIKNILNGLLAYVAKRSY